MKLVDTLDTLIMLRCSSDPLYEEFMSSNRIIYRDVMLENLDLYPNENLILVCASHDLDEILDLNSVSIKELYNAYSIKPDVILEWMDKT